MRDIGRYQPVGLLAEGGMASVYLAVQKGGAGTQRLAVVKVVKRALAGDSDYQTMFAEETELAMRLAHPNVIHAYEVGDHDGSRYLAMEYLDGQSLLSCFRRAGRRAMAVELHVYVLVELLKALDYAHNLKDYSGVSLDLVHRDVTPGNVFLTYEGNVKLVDFGIAKTTRALLKTEAGVIKGKVTYMAPEQATMGVIGPRTDIFSVGVMLWEALAGRTLVGKHDDPNAILFRRVERGDPKIRDVVPDAPSVLADICDRAMARKADDRFASAAEMQEALETWLRSSESSTTLQRKVARFVSETFAEERATLGKRIDEAMSRTDEGTSSIIALKDPLVLETSSPTLARTVDPSLPPPGRSNEKTRPLGLWLSIGVGATVLAAAAVVAGSNRAGKPIDAPTPPPSTTTLSVTTPPVSGPSEGTGAAPHPQGAAPSVSAPKAPAVPHHGAAAAPPAAPPAPPPVSAKSGRPARPIDKEDPY